MTIPVTLWFITKGKKQKGNTYTPGETFTTVIKLWDDDRDRDGIRPDNIIVRLLADGEEVNRASISAAGGWFTIWTGIPVSNGGQKITYTVTEDEVADYSSEITGDVKAGFTVKNSHESEKIDIEVTKVWNDNDNEKQYRPNSIQVSLIVKGAVVDKHTLTADEGWKTVFTELPKYSGGEEVVYVIAEDEVENYTASITGYTITNTFRDPCTECANRKSSGTTPASSSSSSAVPARSNVKTGDDSNLLFYLVLMVGCGFALTMVTRRRRVRW